MMTEKRRFPRQDINLDVQIEMIDGSTLRAVLLDISQGGARLQLRHPQHLPPFA